MFLISLQSGVNKMNGMLTRQEKIECRMLYRDALNKRKQVTILCQLYDVDRETMCKALGIDFKPRPKKIHPNVQNAIDNSYHSKEYAKIVYNFGSLQNFANKLGVQKSTLQKMLSSPRKLSSFPTGRRMLAELEKVGAKHG